MAFSCSQLGANSTAFQSSSNVADSLDCSMIRLPLKRRHPGTELAYGLPVRSVRDFRRLGQFQPQFIAEGCYRQLLVESLYHEGFEIHGIRDVVGKQGF